MKSFLLAVFLLAVLAGVNADPPKRDLRGLADGVMIDFLECARGKLETGIPEQNIPSFAPLELDSAELELSTLTTVAQGTLQLTNLIVTGVTTFVITAMDTTIQIIPPAYTFAFTIEVDVGTLSTEYEGAITSEDLGLDLAGKGTIVGTARGVSVTIVGRVSILTQKIESLNVAVALDRLENVVITGLGDEQESADWSELILLTGPSIIAENQELINQVVHDLLLSPNASGNGVLSFLMGQCLF